MSTKYETVRWYLDDERPGLGRRQYAQNASGHWFTRYLHWRGDRKVWSIWSWYALPINQFHQPAFIHGRLVEGRLRVPA